jgi:hypothetical protein
MYSPTGPCSVSCPAPTDRWNLHCRPAGTAEERAALEGLKVSVLRAQAVALACDAARIATAEDGEDPRRDFISLILEQQALIKSGLIIQPQLSGGGLGLVPAGAAPQLSVEVGWQGKAIEVLDGSEKWQGKYDTEAEKPGDLAFKQCKSRSSLPLRVMLGSVLTDCLRFQTILSV